VLLAHCPRPDSLQLEVNHIDGDKQNNRAENLEWVSKSDNHRHAYATGLRAVRRTLGASHPGAVLTDDSVREIHRMRAEGATFQSIGARFGIGTTHARRITLGLRWPHIYREFHPEAKP